jgi:uncharacterized protein
MKKSMLDILACPIDKNSPLELYEINIKKDNDNDDVDHNDSNIIITEGVLFCNKCSRFYPIIDEIPIMLPDELREKQTDIDFLQQWNDKIPEKVTKRGNPWHL